MKSNHRNENISQLSDKWGETLKRRFDLRGAPGCFGKSHVKIILPKVKRLIFEA